MEADELWYGLFMDDRVILALTRWKLRAVIRTGGLGRVFAPGVLPGAVAGRGWSRRRGPQGLTVFRDPHYWSRRRDQGHTPAFHRFLLGIGTPNVPVWRRLLSR